MSLQTTPAPVSDFIKHLEREYPRTSEGLATVEGNMATLTQDLEKHVKELKDMEKSLESNARRWHLEAEHAHQYSMRDSVKIYGVPYKANEDTNDLVRRIGVSIGVFLNKQDIRSISNCRHILLVVIAHGITFHKTMISVGLIVQRYCPSSEFTI